MPTLDDHDHALSAAAVSHIERVLVEENLNLRRRLRLMADEAQRERVQRREYEAEEGEIKRLRTALAHVSWAESLDEAQGIADGALSPYRKDPSSG